jgi:hypothetical protein
MNRAAHLVAAILYLVPVRLPGQALEQRLAAYPNGTVRLSFAARPGVCGDGLHNVNTRQESEEWEADCETQPVRVALRIRHAEVQSVHTYLGGHWRRGSSAHDLGTVGASEAAAYFLKLARQSRSVRGDPVLPATLADSVIIWPDLLKLARDPRLPEDRRRTAVFWLGQAAGVAATTALDSVVADDAAGRELRKHAVFALSQRPDNEGVPALIRVARTNRDSELRRTALFWLGQSQDPRAIDLFEEILSAP